MQRQAEQNFFKTVVILGFLFLSEEHSFGGTVGKFCIIDKNNTNWTPIKVAIDYNSFSNPYCFGWDNETTKNLLLAALNTWTAESGAKFGFILVPYTQYDAEYVVEIHARDFGPSDWSIGRTALQITGDNKCIPRYVELNCTYNYSANLPVFSIKYPGGLSDYVNMGTLCIHEIGHVLGLYDTFYNSTMVMHWAQESSTPTNLSWDEIYELRWRTYAWPGVTETYGERMQWLRMFSYPWSGSWLDHGYKPEGYTNMVPAVTGVPGSTDLCVLYANSADYHSPIVAKRGYGTSWVTNSTSSYTTTGVVASSNTNKILAVHVGHILNDWGSTDRKLFYQESTNCTSFSTPYQIGDWQYWDNEYKARSSCMPALAWSPAMGLWILLAAENDADADSIYHRSLYFAIYNPSLANWKVRSGFYTQIRLGNGDRIHARGGLSVTCHDSLPRCYIYWVDDDDANKGRIMSAVVEFNTGDGGIIPWRPQTITPLPYQYASAYGVGDGTFFPQDPHGMKINFFQIVPDSIEQGVLNFIKNNGFYEMVMNLGSGIWNGVGSGYSGSRQKVFAVGSSGPFQYK